MKDLPKVKKSVNDNLRPVDAAVVESETAQVASSLKDFTVTAYRFTMQAGENGLELPPYKGATLRGGFGFVFKKICCVRDQAPCKNCDQEMSCPYAYIFETSPHAGAEKLRNYDDIPRPFVIEPPLERKTNYHPGENLVFTLLLFGRAANFLPFFIVAFRELGLLGLGGRERKSYLHRIEALDLRTGEAENIYRRQDEIIRSKDYPLPLHEPMLGSVNVAPLTVHFQTMTRFKQRGKLTQKADFHILLKSVLRRLAALLYFHGGGSLEIDFKALFRESEKIPIITDKTSWASWQRYSLRQHQRIPMDGLTGSVTYGPAARLFLPLLRVGEIIHVGKNTPFGLGKYEIKEAIAID